MKLATFDSGDGDAHVGIVAGDGLIDLSRALPGLPRDMAGLMAAWPDAEHVLQNVASQPAHHKISDIHLLAPVPRPPKILAIGLNYADHIAESGQTTPERQIWFSKLSSAVNGPFDPIQIPRVSSAVDYEAELVAIIGRRCRHVTKADAPGAVFGYCAGNDVSVRDWQFHSSQWLLGKSFDSHAPIGPWIVTADELRDPHVLGLRTWVNDELRQNANTSGMIFDCFAQIATLTTAFTLEPGDIISTGTPSGVGVMQGKFLVPGDVVRIEIDGIGRLENPIVEEPVTTVLI